MEAESIGYGAGARDLKTPNVLRVFIGNLIRHGSKTDTVYVIATNVDDMNPQLYEYVMDKLFLNGALDVYLTDILMERTDPPLSLPFYQTRTIRTNWLESFLKR